MTFEDYKPIPDAVNLDIDISNFIGQVIDIDWTGNKIFIKLYYQIKPESDNPDDLGEYQHGDLSIAISKEQAIQLAKQLRFNASQLVAYGRK